MEILRKIDDDHIVYLGRQFVSFQRVGVLMNKWKEEQMGIVRCKDCAWYVEIARPCPMCARLDRAVEEDDYCSWGGRKEADADRVD